MKKLLLSSLVIGALFSSSCSKNEFIQEQSQGENQKISDQLPNPTPVLAPTVYYMRGDMLYSIKNLAATSPSTKYEGNVTNIYLYDPTIKTNIFNNNAGFPIVYDKYTDRMLTIDAELALNKCYIPTKGTSKTTLPKLWPANALALGVGQDKKFYYFGEHSENINGTPSFNQIRKVNLDGTGSEAVYTYNESVGQKVPYQSAVINFTKNVIYSSESGSSSKIYETDMTPNNVNKSKVLPILVFTGESLGSSKLRFDPKNNLLYYTTTSQNWFRIYKMDVNVGWGSIKKVVETSYNQNTFINYDVSPLTNTLFYCKALTSQNTTTGHWSSVVKVNLNDPNMNTNSKTLAIGNFAIFNILAAEPVN